MDLVRPLLQSMHYYNKFSFIATRLGGGGRLRNSEGRINHFSHCSAAKATTYAVNYMD